ncbi:MAG TPA: hypothetical protein VFD42_01820 [Chloroflexota bacterium]|nr:hypothetical protein [Chloroflexota bacterium]
MTAPEVRRLLLTLAMARGHEEEVVFALEWSIWRRRHQARARRGHYKMRLARLSSPPPGPT